MKYIASIACGEKKLLSQKNCKISKAPRRIKELSMVLVWPQLENNERILKYMPFLGSRKYPPREFFFKIFASILPILYSEMLQEVSDMRVNIEEEKYNQIQVSKEFLNKFVQNHSKYSFMKMKKIKKLMLK